MKVLLSSAGAKIPLIKALQAAALRLNPDAKVIAGDCTEPVVSQYFSDEFWLMPKCEPSHIQEIVTGLQQRKITHILPSRDGELLFWADLTPILEPLGITVISASNHAISLCLDKYKFSLWGTEQNLPVIPSLLQLNNTAALWVVKERFGAGSNKLGLALSSAQALEHAAQLQSPIFQPFINGKEISIDAWLDKHSKLKGHIYRYRTKVQHGESQITQSVALPIYDTIVKTVLESLQLKGPVVLQAIITPDTQLHIIECNSRFGGASTLGIKAGVDSLYWSLAESLGCDLNAMQFKPAPPPITQVRYAGDIYL